MRRRDSAASFLLETAVALLASAAAGLAEAGCPRIARRLVGIVLVAAANGSNLCVRRPLTRGSEGTRHLLNPRRGARARLRYSPEAPFYPPQAGVRGRRGASWRLRLTGGRLANGYSGYVPGSCRTHAASFWFFPERLPPHR